MKSEKIAYTYAHMHQQLSLQLIHISCNNYSQLSRVIYTGHHNVERK